MKPPTFTPLSTIERFCLGPWYWPVVALGAILGGTLMYLAVC